MRKDYPFNLAWIQQMASGLEPAYAPRARDCYTLGVGLTSRCNYRCAICYYHSGPALVGAGDLPLEKLRRILNGLPHLKGIFLGTDGEPFLYPHLFAALELAACHASALLLASNGSLLDREICRRLADFPIASFSLSIDAADDESYGRLRRGGNLKTFMRHAQWLTDSLGSPTRFHATICHENLASLLRLPALAHQVGIQRITFQQLRSHEGSYTRGVSRASGHELARWLEEMLAQAQKYAIILEPDHCFGGRHLAETLRRLATLAPENFTLPHMDRGACPHAEGIACIMADGSLFPCAGDFEPAPLAEYDFDAIFNHPYLTALRALRRARRANLACSMCMNDLP